MSCVLMTILILYPSLIALKQQDRYTCFRSLCFFLPLLPERGKDTFLFRYSIDLVLLHFVCVYATCNVILVQIFSN